MYRLEPDITGTTVDWWRERTKRLGGEVVTVKSLECRAENLICKSEQHHKIINLSPMLSAEQIGEPSVVDVTSIWKFTSNIQSIGQFPIKVQYKL